MILESIIVGGVMALLGGGVGYQTGKVKRQNKEIEETKKVNNQLFKSINKVCNESITYKVEKEILQENLRVHTRYNDLKIQLDNIKQEIKVKDIQLKQKEKELIKLDNGDLRDLLVKYEELFLKLESEYNDIEDLLSPTKTLLEKRQIEESRKELERVKKQSIINEGNPFNKFDKQ